MTDPGVGVALPSHTISVVIPVYRGETTLPALLAEIEPYTKPGKTIAGYEYVVSEVLLVHDSGPDGSAQVIRDLDQRYDFVHPIWLSRNFGQHAATLAGMVSSGSEWIVTMDEDGQHDPADIGRFLDVAMETRCTLVYADPRNAPPHGVLRNAASRSAKWIFARFFASGTDIGVFQSYRLMLGEIGRSVAAYAGSGVFLDVAIGWVNPSVSCCPVTLRSENGRRSGYTLRGLLSHFWRLVITSGTRGLRLVSVLGLLFALVGFGLAGVVVIARVTDQVPVQGWASVMVGLLLATGAILFSLGIIAEYLGSAVNMAMGKPLYLIVGDPMAGPLGRRDPHTDG
jgi:undecaprenyl-phosphate 4-deoxy-4-formamido-L-arabinose transferase